MIRARQVLGTRAILAELEHVESLWLQKVREKEERNPGTKLYLKWNIRLHKRREPRLQVQVPTHYQVMAKHRDQKCYIYWCENCRACFVPFLFGWTFFVIFVKLKEKKIWWIRIISTFWVLGKYLLENCINKFLSKRKAVEEYEILKNNILESTKILLNWPKIL